MSAYDTVQDLVELLTHAIFTASAAFNTQRLGPNPYLYPKVMQTEPCITSWEQRTRSNSGIMLEQP